MTLITLTLSDNISPGSQLLASDQVTWVRLEQLLHGAVIRDRCQHHGEDLQASQCDASWVAVDQSQYLLCIFVNPFLAPGWVRSNFWCLRYHLWFMTKAAFLQLLTYESYIFLSDYLFQWKRWTIPISLQESFIGGFTLCYIFLDINVSYHLQTFINRICSFEKELNINNHKLLHINTKLKKNKK